MSKLVQVCPVCKGKGIVKSGFYNIETFMRRINPSQTSETCRSCNGKGVIIINENYEIKIE